MIPILSVSMGAADIVKRAFDLDLAEAKSWDRLQQLALGRRDEAGGQPYFDRIRSTFHAASSSECAIILAVLYSMGFSSLIDELTPPGGVQFLGYLAQAKGEHLALALSAVASRDRRVEVVLRL